MESRMDFFEANLAYEYVEALMDVFLSYVRVVQPDVMWTLAYVIFFSWMYLFHAPFRVHSSRVDWYSQLTKVLQIWLGVVALLFHVGPTFFQTRRQASSSLLWGTSEEDAVAAVFFPTFSTTTLIIAYAHKKKREWGLVLTYGSTATVVLLNALLLSLFSTMHYVYCLQLQERDRPTWVGGAVGFVCPAPKGQAPILLLVQLTLLNILFMAMDYQYKRLRGYDPMRGLLWSDVFDIRRGDARVGPVSACSGDWRRMESRPRRVGRGKPFQSSPQPQKLSDSFPSRTVVGTSFAVCRDDLEELVAGEHPVNRPGMVPWFSTFIAGTALQAVLGAVLNFLTFDQRSVERYASPKIFDLSFTNRIDLVSSSGASELSTSDILPVSNRRTSAGVPAADVWFDFVGDVGDGFNSTYEIARLMAQPSLSLSCRDARRTNKKNWVRGGRRDRAAALSRSPSIGHMTSGSAPSSPKSGLSSLFLDDYRPSEHHILPRASFVIIGGDLAYPNPTEETYEKRLVGPYNDALRGCPRLRELMQESYDNILVRSKENKDVANMTLLTSTRVGAITHRGGLVKLPTEEEVLRSVPLLFAIPGNHDWLDGLVTFRQFVIEESWLGGWFMPQRSSFFIIKLPYNWFLLCGDTGSTADIDSTQRNYFIHYINENLDNDSCVILTCHEPSWIYEEMYSNRSSPLQPQLNRVIDVLGTRLRLRLCGDIHNYSRHTPADAFSEAPILVVSGGGGAFLHGARSGLVVSQGTEYRRSAAFPLRNNTTGILARLVGFRIINWQFDIIAGFLCFGLIFSVLPLAMKGDESHEVQDVSQFVANVVKLTLELGLFTFDKAVVSFFVILLFFSVFFSAGADKKSIVFRILYGTYWTFLVLIASTGTLALVHTTLLYMTNNRMLLSRRDHWESMMEVQVRKATKEFLNHTRKLLGEEHVVSKGVSKMQSITSRNIIVGLTCFALRSLDVVENFAYLSHHVSMNVTGTFSSTTDRLHIFLYIVHLLLVYWLLATPLVSLVIGLFLFVSVYFFDFMYDAAYSSFQIEDYKHFVRFRLDGTTRELHGYVVAEKHVPKMWERDAKYVAEFNRPDSKHLPPHLRNSPSRWRPTQDGEKESKAEVLEHFVVKTHRTSA